jgi:ankyrin repeat protein
VVLGLGPAVAQIPPSSEQIARYSGLHAAAAKGDVAGIALAHATGADPNQRDADGRTPLHVAAFLKQYDAARALLAIGADPNALERQRYDIVTIAAVANDVEMLKLALVGGCSAKNVTSPYDGTALIAAAHLGHAEVVRELIKAGAPLDHVNNLGWTALIEAVILGDGGKNHQETVAALVKAGAKLDLADRGGATPLALARNRNYREIEKILKDAGAT